MYYLGVSRPQYPESTGGGGGQLYGVEGLDNEHVIAE